MASLSVFNVEHVSMISNLISLCTRIATLPSCLFWSIIARNGIIRDIKLKSTFKPGFIESKDVNIILFQKERYFHLLISAAAYICVPILEELKELYEAMVLKRWRCSRIVSQYEPLYIPVDQWCCNLFYWFSITLWWWFLLVNVYYLV